MAERKSVELLGSHDAGLRLSGAGAKASVAVDAAVMGKTTASLRAAASAAAATAAPDRIFLNLENVTGNDDATAFDVYVNLPEGGDPAKYPDHLAGSIALFGVGAATSADGPGHGLTFVLEITHVVDALHLAGTLNANPLQVQLVPVRPVPDDAQIKVGRISVFRQGQ